MKAFARLALLLGVAQITLIAICAAALLLSACGPTDTEALQDVALDLSDAQQQARAERRNPPRPGAGEAGD